MDYFLQASVRGDINWNQPLVVAVRRAAAHAYTARLYLCCPVSHGSCGTTAPAHVNWPADDSPIPTIWTEAQPCDKLTGVSKSWT